ncbi:hypothetical protein [Halorubellus litoreus]|uniref:Envelope protein N-terminal domain-containing protein n=1 Tax=Halorubellus litoreus TaxID=755308 RepID=A0ABD5V954_9EURY
MDSTTTTGKAYRLLIVALVVAVAFQPMLGAALAAGADDAATKELGVQLQPDCNPPSTGDLAVDLVVGRLDEGYAIARNALDGGSVLEANQTCYSGEVIKNASHAEAFAAADVGFSHYSTLLTTMENRLKDSETYVWADVKADVAKEYRNESNTSVMKTSANQTVEKYYTTVAMNEYASWNTSAHHAYMIFNSSEQYGFNTSLALDDLPGTGGSPKATTHSFEFGTLGLGTSEAPLPNGSTTTVARLIVYNSAGDVVFNMTPHDHGPNSSTHTAIWIDDPEATSLAADPGDQVFLDQEDYYNRTQDVLDRTERMKENAAQFVDAIESKTNSSDFDSMDIVDCTTMTSQFNTDLESTGYYGWAAGEMGCMGINGSINNSFSITYDEVPSQIYNASSSSYETVDPEPVNLTGTMFTDWKPAKTNGSFVVNTTYDTSNTNSPVYFVAQVNANETERFILNGTFTIESLRNVKTGESVNRTSTQEQVRATSNATFTKQELLDILQYRDKTLNTHSSDTETPPPEFDFGNISPFGAGVGALVALGVVVVVGKEFAS